MMVACAVALASGCDDGASSGMDAGPMGPQTAEPSAQTAELLAQIEGYQDWPNFPENTSPTESESHLGLYVLAFYNPIDGDAITNHTLPLPDGAIIVKNNYADSAGTQLRAVTIMSKRSGMWYWAKTTPDGRVFVGPNGAPAEGTDVQSCINCHMGASANDMVFTHQFAAAVDAGT